VLKHESRRPATWLICDVSRRTDMILAFILALVSIPITATLTSLFTLPVAAVGKRLQWRNKTMEEWRGRGVLSPGERLRSVSIFFGFIATSVTKTAALIVAAFIFSAFGRTMPIGFVVVAAGLIVLQDVGRISRFLGNSGVWTELGYLFGDIAGATIGTLVAFHWIL
jgi:hypothetical protein